MTSPGSITTILLGKFSAGEAQPEPILREINMWIPIAVTIAVIAVALAPVMMIAPSKYQRRIAQLRTHANALGLQVRLMEPPTRADLQGNEGHSVACYLLPWRSSQNNDDAEISAARWPRKPHFEWSLVKGKYRHDIHFDGYWQWSGNSEAPPAMQATIKNALSELSNDVIALAADRQGVSLSWWEGGSIADVDRWLEILESLRASDEALQKTRLTNDR